MNIQYMPYHYVLISVTDMDRIKKILTFYNNIAKWNASNINGYHDRLKSWVKTFVLAGRMFYVKDMWARDVAALTFASFMALIPCMAMIFVMGRGFGYTAMIESWLSATFESQPIVAETISNFVNNYIENTKSNYIIGAGVLMLLYTVISLMQKIELTFDDIWHTEERSWKKIATEYPTIFFGLGLLVLFSSSLNVWAIQIVKNVDAYSGIGDVIPTFIIRMASMISLVLFYIFCYSTIPNTYVKIKHTLIPALLAGICMSMLQYGYIYLQVFLSSYNMIYGSLAAIPLFLLWLQITWAISILGAILCYMRQNLHHYDGDIEYENLDYVSRIKVCTMVMHHVCKQFQSGGKALTSKDIHSLTEIPQQIVNHGVAALIRAGLLVEIRDISHTSFEESVRLHPVENVDSLTYGVMIERLNRSGDDISHFFADDGNKGWEKIDEVYNRYIMDGKSLPLAEL